MRVGTPQFEKFSISKNATRTHPPLHRNTRSRGVSVWSPGGLLVFSAGHTPGTGQGRFLTKKRPKPRVSKRIKGSRRLQCRLFESGKSPKNSKICHPGFETVWRALKTRSLQTDTGHSPLGLEIRRAPCPLFQCWRSDSQDEKTSRFRWGKGAQSRPIVSQPARHAALKFKMNS